MDKLFSVYDAVGLPRARRPEALRGLARRRLAEAEQMRRSGADPEFLLYTPAEAERDAVEAEASAARCEALAAEIERVHAALGVQVMISPLSGERYFV